jgi:hypothetical protein
MTKHADYEWVREVKASYDPPCNETKLGATDQVSKKIHGHKSDISRLEVMVFKTLRKASKLFNSE